MKSAVCAETFSLKSLYSHVWWVTELAWEATENVPNEPAPCEWNLGAKTLVYSFIFHWQKRNRWICHLRRTRSCDFILCHSMDKEFIHSLSLTNSSAFHKPSYFQQCCNFLTTVQMSKLQQTYNVVAFQSFNISERTEINNILRFLQIVENRAITPNSSLSLSSPKGF